MTRYAVGDLQGCLQPLQCLLEEVNFDPASDQLWLLGDLINRGPESLATLRFVKALGDSTRIVLGNHDLHFLAVASGIRAAGKSDTFTELLAAEDCKALVQWLLQQKLFYSDPSLDYHMVHAGIPPIWSIEQTRRYATEVEQVLQSEQANDFFQQMYGNEPNCWSEQLTGMTRLRVITNYLTRMRFCTADGRMDFTNKLARYSGDQAALFAPWFSHPNPWQGQGNILFGHWAALEGKVNSSHIYGLDTGCVWGRSLTLMNLEEKTLHSCKCQAQA